MRGGNILNRVGTDFWPNALFDTREGAIRDVSPAGSIGAAPTINYKDMVTPGGVMQYVEVDAGKHRQVAGWHDSRKRPRLVGSVDGP